MTAPKRQEAEAVDPLSSTCRSALQRSLVADGASSTSGPRRMLSEAQVLAIVPVSPTTLWRMVKRGEFPAPVFISPNKKVWFEDEVIAWQSALDEHGRRRRRAR